MAKPLAGSVTVSGNFTDTSFDLLVFSRHGSLIGQTHHDTPIPPISEIMRIVEEDYTLDSRARYKATLFPT